jgi:hypothetical protein
VAPAITVEESDSSAARLTLPRSYLFDLMQRLLRQAEDDEAAPEFAEAQFVIAGFVRMAESASESAQEPEPRTVITDLEARNLNLAREVATLTAKLVDERVKATAELRDLLATTIAVRKRADAYEGQLTEFLKAVSGPVPYTWAGLRIMALQVAAVLSQYGPKKKPEAA